MLNNEHQGHRIVIYSLNFFIVGLANNIRIKKVSFKVELESILREKNNYKTHPHPHVYRGHSELPEEGRE